MSFELIQLFAGIGCFDIDDILLNLIGAVMGYFIGRLFTNNSNQLNVKERKEINNEHY